MRLPLLLPVSLALLGLTVVSGGPHGAAARVRDAQASDRARSAGEALVRDLACGVCHQGLPTPGTAAAGPPLGAAGRLYEPGWLFEYFGRDRVTGARGSPRMPAFRLDEGEALALALFLGRGRGEGQALRDARQRHPEVGADAGRRIFIALNCAGCHEHESVAPEPNGPPLALEGSRARSEWLASFLRRPYAVRPFGFSPGTGGRMPDFGLSGDEADSIAAFLSTFVVPLPSFDAGGLTRFDSAKADALLRSRLDCLGCHALDGIGGRIGPDLGDVARRTPEYVRAMIDDPERLVPGTIMPRPRLPPGQADLIARFLLSRAPDSGAARPARAFSLADTPPVPRGDTGVAALYASHCALCHGARGRGDGFNARFLPVRPAIHADAEAMGRRPDDTLFDGIAGGGRILGLSPLMPAFGGSLAPETIRDLVGYIRTLCRCAQPAWAGDGAFR